MYSRVYNNNNNKKPILFEIYITYIYMCACIYNYIYACIKDITAK